MGQRPVSVTLRTRQVLDGEETHLEQQTEGELIATEGGWQLCYREPSDGGETCLTIEEGLACLERRGKAATQMCFRPGDLYPAQYQTPYGTLELWVDTQYLGSSLAEDGGRVMIRYQLYGQGQTLGRFTLQVYVRAADISGK